MKRELAEFPKYECCRKGRIYRKGNPIPLAGSTHHTGYIKHNLRNCSGKIKNVLAHVFIARCFHGEIPPGHEVNHKKGLKKDNRPSQLEVILVKKNMLHSLTELGNCKLSFEIAEEIRKKLKDGVKVSELKKEYNIGHTNIYRIRDNKIWTKEYHAN